MAKQPAAKSIYVIAGKDRYLKQAAAHDLQNSLLGEDEGMGLSTYDGKAVDIGTMLDELHTVPFLAPRRVVIIDDADKLISEERDLFEKYFAQPSQTGVLVLMCETWRSNTKLAKALPKIGQLITAEPKKGRELAQWVSSEAKRLGKNLPVNVAQSLVEVVGSDTGRIINELEKLSLFVGQRPTITLEDVEQLSGPTAEQSIFLINDLMAEGKAEEALTTLDRLMRNDRSAEYTMVGALAFSLRRLLKARALADAGYSLRDIPRECGITYPGLADRFMAQVKRFTAAELKHLLAELAEADRASKTGVGDAKLNLEKFIVCAANPR
ncbi:MAG: DNA polymerase III subunit delta [Phycisphaerae bacterium]|nr:DNA polymerase III subunit delta [Phycisphaerae bacterium]